MKLLYTTAFGNEYVSMAKLCIRSVLKYATNVDIYIFTDKQCFDEFEGVKTILIKEPLTVYQKLDFRKRLADYVDLSSYEQVWFTDPDILFKRSPFNLFDDTAELKVCREPWTSLGGKIAWFSKGIYDLEPIKEENGINGGFYMIPKNLYKDFFEVYKKECARFPGELSADQFALNSIHYNKLLPSSVMPLDVMCFPTRWKYDNHCICHYVGMSGENKIRMMHNES